MAKKQTQYWLIDPNQLPDPDETVASIRTGFKETTGYAVSTAARAAAMEEDFWAEDKWYAEYRPYNVINGKLVIPVIGTMLNKFPFCLDFGWFAATGYEYIQAAVERGLEDSEVAEIIFAIDSPGGMVAGLFEMCDDIMGMKAESDKPITAYCQDGGAYSAAYAVACCAEKIVVERMAGTGSVGVVTMHVDLSKALEKDGVKVTYIYSGKHKVDGNPYEALSDDVKKRIQARIEKIYGVFVSHVAKGRGMDEKAVRATEALTFDAEDSIEVKFADSIGRLTTDLSAPPRKKDEPTSATADANHGETPMADETKTQENAAPDNAAVDTARAEGKAEGAKAERERFAAVQASEEYAGRETLASHLLASTDMDAEAIIGTLAAAPKTAPAAAETETGAKPGAGEQFNAAMDTSGNPDATSEEITDEASESEQRAEALATAASKLPKRRR